MEAPARSLIPGRPPRPARARTPRRTARPAQARGPVAGVPRRALAALAAALLTLAGPARAQKTKHKLPRWKIDPYTKNDPKAMKRAGYVSFGPFPIGDAHGTAEVEKALPKTKIRWVETAHFRIGSALPAWTIPFDPKIKKRYRAELTELKKKLPRVNPRAKRLDPWLRVHLFAHRLEKLYADFERRLGVTDDDFPDKPSTLVNGKYMGEGKYLGMKQKYVVLMFSKLGDHIRYLSLFVGTTQRFAKRHHFKVFGSLLLCTAEEVDDGRLKNDVALHVHVIWNTTHNLVDGFRLYHVDIPVWFKEGLAHWYGRRVDPKWNNFDQNESSKADMRATWRWNVAVRRRIDSDRFTPFAEVARWRDYGQINFYDHMAIWSRVDFLMATRGDEGLRKFLFIIKEPPGNGMDLSAAKEILKRQRRAMQEAWGLTPLSLDREWKEWVKKNYPIR